MGTFLKDFLIVLGLFILLAGAGAAITLDWAVFQAKKRFAKIGDEYGSFEHEGKWYVIKREGE